MKAVSVPSSLAHSDSDAGKAWSTFQLQPRDKLGTGRQPFDYAQDKRADNESYDFAVIRSLCFAVICCNRYKSEVRDERTL